MERESFVSNSAKFDNIGHPQIVVYNFVNGIFIGKPDIYIKRFFENKLSGYQNSICRRCYMIIHTCVSKCREDPHS